MHKNYFHFYHLSVVIFEISIKCKSLRVNGANGFKIKIELQAKSLFTTNGFEDII